MFVGIGLNLVRGGGSASPASLFAAAEPGTWYDPSDLTTLFQDSAGTTPVTAPNQTVGLMLDKSQGLVLGPELSVSSGTVFRDNVLPNVTFNTGVSITAGKTYLISYTVTNAGSTSSSSWRIGGTGGLTNLTNVASGFSGAVTAMFVSSASGSLSLNADNAIVNITLSGVSIKLLAGNHAAQATLGQRPTYGVNPITGTRNLLTYTEQFDNAGWTKTGLLTVSANSFIAPDGTTTADTLTEDTSNGGHSVTQTLTKAASAQTYTASAFVRPNGRTVVRLRLNDSSNTNNATAEFTLTGSGTSASPTVAGTFTSASAAITSVGGGWYRLSVTATTGTETGLGAVLFLTNGSSAFYLGNGTSGVYIWGAQLELGSTATAYQKVVTQYEVTEAGVQSASYISFDGTDDGMVTGTITPAIDKVQVFAGIRKLSDAAIALIAEFSANVNSNNGSFWLGAPINPAAANYQFSSKGTVAVGANYTNASVAAPITNIVTSIGDIAGDNATLRINGTQAAETLTDQGTGNYLAYPLYIGRRGGSSLPFNGRIYSLIVRFGANLTDGQITSTESWVNSKTGAMTWILTQGAWYDDGQWYDTATWNDGV
jgi:hypothetical protein